MSTLRYELICATKNRAITLTDTNIHNDIHKQFEFQRQTVLVDKILTYDEKTIAIKFLIEDYDRNKIIDNNGTRRICESCNQKCLATLYCEFCVRNYLKENFSNWTSGNYDIDNLIQKCQMEALAPDMVVEWIPYSDLENIKYLTKENVESANQSWFEEAKTHLTISNKWADVARCYGLTQNPSNGNYMLVMYRMDIDLRKYLQQNHNQLTWKDRMYIINKITVALYRIHFEKAVHRDLHSGNILYSQLNNSWRVKEQEVFYSKLYDFNIPNDINDFNKSNEQNSSKSSKVIAIFRDDDEVYNNPNFHSKEQDELEIPDVEG
ncbi:hypothetical protein RhiirC2_787965 [Rhizophagus irregularis]|uniref:Protein kinase domain-containing protein n=1 Tax=Rhizophagus irregularis TaxID=588596 RepID=A0A2N1MR47_9GLOM|nr:hypothetical protein RhiirC2_787965 [Rhizophagus irregularis]